MSSPRPLLKGLIIVAILVLAGVFLLRGFKPADPTPQVAGKDRAQGVANTGGEPGATPPARPQRTAKTARPPVDSERVWQLAGDDGREFVLALDQAVRKDADGKETLVKLEPPATEATLKARLADLQAWPVVYLAGEPRSEATRRILTPDLRVRLDGADPALVARAATVEIKDLPTHAPGWAVLAAADPFAALDAMDRLRALGHATADVLLAVQRQKRAMPNDTLITNQWHLKNTNTTRTHINVESVWNYPNTGIRGTGIRIGIVDDGLQTAHPDFVNNIDTSNDKDWNGNDADPNPGTGDDHGTACAGNAGARGNNNLGVSGSAPESTLVGLRLIAASVSDAQEAEAMAWANDIIQIKSNSWGPSDTGTILEAPGPITASAFQTAATSGRGGRGTIFLWAGGNGGGSSDNSNYDGYANSIHTIAIGASDSNGNRASYSEPGANLVVVAPSDGAIGITTTDRTGSNGYNTASTANGGDYTNDFGGTSSATPTAAGVVALMLDKNPNLGWRDVQEILIRSAFKIKPTDAGWANNGAGIPFNHNFGAGLIDATAAVSLADGWVNLTSQQTTSLAATGLPLAIPDNNTTGITRSFDFSSSNLRIEHVTVRMSATHTYRGDLVVTLTSPTGMTSRLAEKRSDSNDNYSNWTFSSVRHWGESSAGVWTLKITDAASGDAGTLTAATITLFGTQAALVNPPPLVQITAPQNGAVFSPGATVNVAVNATDLTQSGTTGTVSQVELLQNGSVVGTDNTAPYTFAITPANGSHTLVARATDSEAAVATSASVSISVVNQPPAITAATLSAGAQGYADEGLAVASVNAVDPENDTLAYQYQWQASSDGVTFADVTGATAANLTAAPALAGQLWRCVITASDAANTSAPFTTTATNLLNRPPATADIGAAFSYSSGLVLRGSGGTPGTRQAIIHEFSQGPAGGTAEWIEILTLQAGSLAFWDIQDAAGNILVFLDAAVWDDIPAGTLIVVYNGGSKDPLLPADDTDPADGRMVVSSTNPAYFDSNYDAWPSLGNSGDAIFLSDADSNTIHEIAYGNSTAATPNVGAVGSGKSAYFTGDTDEAANLAANWRVTTSTTARAISTRAAGDLFISEYVEGSSNNRALELYNPSASPVNLATLAYKIEIYFNGATSAASNINLTGSIPAGGTFVIKNNLATSITAQQESGSLTFTGDDAIVLKKGTSVVDSVGQVGVDPGSAWTGGGVSTIDKTLRRKPEVLVGDMVTNDAFDPSTQWLQFNQDDFTGLGSHTTISPTTTLTLTITPTTFAENAGANAATGTVSIPAALAGPLTVALFSNDTSEATVPASVVIPTGQTSVNFAVAAIDDTDSDGPQNILISATADGHQAGSFALTVTDNEPSLEGVTPGSGNTPANITFITQLRTGSLGTPALYRLGAGVVLPAGLTLDPDTGVISGTIDSSNPPGNYPITLERYNPQGEVVSTSFTLAIGTTGGDFAAWIAGYPAAGLLNGRLDDPDADGLPNAVENLLGSSPTAASPGLQQVSANGSSLVFHHTFAAQPASDVTGSYEWSPDLVQWHASGAQAGGGVITITSQTVTDPVHPQGWKRVTATATPGVPPQWFVRLRAD
jgi:subtilisin-like proprotein convertase family protein